MNYPTRKINDTEMSDRIKFLERQGIVTPILNFSNFIPTYVETRENGVEIYNHGGRIVEVRAGEVIDSHGNVVNLERRETQAMEKIMESCANPSKVEPVSKYHTARREREFLIGDVIYKESELPVIGETILDRSVKENRYHSVLTGIKKRLSDIDSTRL